MPDPSATPPDDWDVDEDGEWEAPLVDNPDCSGEGKGCGEWKAKEIANPDYKGKWHAPRVDNPAYLGVWKPRQVDNPHYFEDEAPWAMAPIGGIGIELWTMQSGILFDNIVLAGSLVRVRVRVRANPNPNPNPNPSPNPNPNLPSTPAR